MKWRWVAALAGLLAVIAVVRCGLLSEASAPSSETTAAARASGTSASEDSHGCSHPYVPTQVGVTREYRWESTTGAGTLRMRLVGEGRDGDAHELRWSIEADEPIEIIRRCDETGAEEPWLALGGATGLELTGQSWRVPRDLCVGDEYSGTFVATVLGFASTITRSHRVVGRETLAAAGRDYDTLRIEVEERTANASEPVVSTQWVAEGVGLVRLWVGPEGYRTELQLTSVTRAD